MAPRKNSPIGQSEDDHDTYLWKIVRGDGTVHVLKLNKVNYQAAIDLKLSIHMSHGYPAFFLEKKHIYVHTWVAEKMGIKNETLVDHINGDKCDARIKNLRKVTASQNGYNKSKSAGAASKYYNVSYDKKCKKWKVQIKLPDKTIARYHFEREEDAAYKADLVKEKHGLTHSKRNNIEKPDGFDSRDYEPIKRSCKKKGRTHKLKTKDFDDGTSIIYGESKGEPFEVKLDTDKCHRLNEEGYTVYMNNTGYASVKGDFVQLMHRWILGLGKAKNNDAVDHINGDRLDNRLVNLRDIGKQGNANNKNGSVRAVSGVRGVTKPRNSKKWTARLVRNKTVKLLGSFDTLEEAVLARKEAEQKFLETGQL